MPKNHALSKPAGEVIIVVLGVMIALAADSWRQGLLDRRTESDYLARISADLHSGRDQILRLRANFGVTQEAAWSLSEALDGSQARPGDNVLIGYFLAAARTGFVEANISHDRTYRELVATGRLAIIRDLQVRESLTEYYQRVEQLTQSLNDLPQDVFRRLTQLTGYPGLRFANGDVELSPTARLRLIRELADTPQIVRELRETHARLDLNARRFSRLIQLSDELLALLD